MLMMNVSPAAGQTAPQPCDESERYTAYEHSQPKKEKKIFITIKTQ